MAAAAKSATVLLLSALAALTLILPGQAARAQVPDHTVVGDRLVLSGSFKEVAPAGTTPKPHQAAVVRPTLSAEELASPLGFEVSLQMKDIAGLDRRLAAGEHIWSAELNSHYMPSATDYAAVEAWLTSQGFAITQHDGHNLALFARGTVAQVQSAFQVRFAQVAFKGENYVSAVTAPSVPASLPSVLGVIGLQPYQKKHLMHMPMNDRLPVTSYENQPPYFCSEILKAYDGASLGLTGSGQEMGIIIDAVPLPADLEEFWSLQSINQSINNITSETIQDVSGRGADPRSMEETLDVSWTSGVASAGTVHIFDCQNLSDANTDAAYSQCATELKNGTRPHMHQLSMSYGGGENEEDPSELMTDHQYFTTITGYGVSVFASSGDNGAFDEDSSQAKSPENPASDPSVTGVGGTSLVLNTSTGAIASEKGWTTDGTYLQQKAGANIGASGGGVSGVFARPSWQTGTGVPSGSTRLVPDVASAADQNEAALIVFTDPSTGQQNVGGIGGTSWAAPCWNAYTALFNQQRASAGKAALGFLNPQIYPLLGTSSFHDITVGNNSHYEENDGYSCTVGYDLVTGLGSPVLANLLAALNSGGGGGGTAPTITSFTPTSGPVGTTVTINGTNLGTISGVFFNDTQVQSGSTVSATQITAVVPSGATTGPITVVTPNGQVSSSTNFTVTTSGGTAPTITSFTPTSGPVGTTVTINGTNLSSINDVYFNGTVVQSGQLVSATQITAVVPSGATTGKIEVVTPSGSVTSTGTFTVTTSGGGTAPTITSFTPTSGPVGTTVTINGTNLSSINDVYFNGTVVQSGQLVSATQITAVVPSGATTGKIEVVTPSGSVTSSASFTVTGSGGGTAPTITSFTPTSGPVGTTVTINGTNLSSINDVYFNGTVVQSGQLVSATQITAVVPSGATTGKIEVVTPSGSVTSTGTFTVTTSGGGTAPTITSFTPTSGPVGTTVTINGTNLGTATDVYFNQTDISQGTIVSATQLSVVVPTGATTGKITVVTSSGQVTSTGTFTVTTAAKVPVVTSATTGTATQGVAFSYQITATNSPTSYGVQGLPAGVSVNTSTGLISGKFAGAGSVKLTLNVYNAAGKGTATLTVTVKAAPPVITSATTATGKVGTAFSFQITATNSPTSYGVQGLGDGLSVNSKTGLITGTPTTAGTLTLTVNVYNAAGKTSGSLKVTITAATAAVPVITSATTATAKKGTAFSFQITATNSPTAYGVQGLADGLSVNSKTGLITGTPTTAETLKLTLNVYNAAGKTSGTLTITVSSGAFGGVEDVDAVKPSTPTDN